MLLYIEQYKGCREQRCFYSGVEWFANYLWLRHSWKLSPNHLTNDLNSLFTATHIPFYFLHAFVALKHRQIYEKPHKSIAGPLLFIVGQSIFLLWRHTNTFHDVILTDCPHNVSKWVTCVSRLSSSYHSLIIDSESRRFHRLACKNTLFLLHINQDILFP